MQEKISTKSTFTWLAQRISALFLVIFLFTHVNFNHLIDWQAGEHGWRGLIDFMFVRERLLSGTLFWKVFYFSFIPICVFHAVNGLWGIIADYRPSGRVAIFLQAVLMLIALALIYFGLSTIFNLFGLGTGGSNV
jgi:succinate dehydrogenase hydrophobic anchor subunit